MNKSQPTPPKCIRSQKGSQSHTNPSAVKSSYQHFSKLAIREGTPTSSHLGRRGMIRSLALRAHHLTLCTHSRFRGVRLSARIHDTWYLGHGAVQNRHVENGDENLPSLHRGRNHQEHGAHSRAAQVSASSSTSIWSHDCQSTKMHIAGKLEYMHQLPKT